MHQEYDHRKFDELASKLEVTLKSFYSDKMCLIDSNVWMNSEFKGLLLILLRLLVADNSSVSALGIQLDEIVNIKREHDSHEARQGLRMIELFQKAGCIKLIGVGARPNNSAYADPVILETILHATENGTYVCLLTEDRDLRIRARELINRDCLDIPVTTDLLPLVNPYESMRAIVLNDCDVAGHPAKLLNFGPQNIWTFLIRSVVSGKVLDVDLRKVSGKVLFMTYTMDTIENSELQQWAHIAGGLNQGFYFMGHYSANEKSWVISIRTFRNLTNRYFPQDKDLSWSLAPIEEGRSGSKVAYVEKPYLWRLQQLWDGSWIIRSASSGLVLDLPHGEEVDGKRVHMWEYHGKPNQRWLIQPFSTEY